MCRDSSQLKHIKLILITVFQAQTKEKAAFISLEQVDLKKKHAIRKKKKDNPILWMQLTVNLDLYLKILFYSSSLRLASSKIEVHANY